MKIPVFVFLCCLLVSCRSLTYFESPNHLRNIDGTLYLQNGRSVTGKLMVQTDNLLGSPVKVYTEDDRKPMQFKLATVKAYTVDNQLYELKEIREGFTLGRQLFFMRRLTPADSRMHLYEHRKKETVNKTATRYHVEHYVQLPGESSELVYAASGSRFVPNFDAKMRTLVADCPALAKKIAAREDGYFYAQVSLFEEKRLQVLRRIIDEYNQCTPASLP